MPACARRCLIDRKRVQVVHCISRCVRRAYLCGKDLRTGTDYGHRREWIRQLLEELAAFFAIEIGFYSVMQNHLHLVLRSRPDVARRWPKEKVVRCWLKVAKLKRGSSRFDWEPAPELVHSEMKDARRVKRLRRRLGNVSWFMGALAENISRRANADDGCTGHFWEQRFKARDLVDVGAVLVAGVYVDLNPIRSGVTLTPEDSRYTSAYDRIASYRQKQAGLRASPKGIGSWRTPDCWLCEFTLQEHLQSNEGDDAMNQTPWRASKKGLLPISLEDYLKLLDWTGRQVREHDRGVIPSDLAPILDRIEIGRENWLTTIREYDSRFGRVVGRFEQRADSKTTTEPNS